MTSVNQTLPGFASSQPRQHAAGGRSVGACAVDGKQRSDARLLTGACGIRSGGSAGKECNKNNVSRR